MEPSGKYILDTHVLYWYLRSPDRLSPAANAAFALAETGNAELVVPAIVIAELYYLSAKLGQPLSPMEIMDTFDEVDGMILSELGRAQLERLDQFPEIPEMHDRLIVAEADALGAAIVTRDNTLRSSESVPTVW